MQANNNNAKSNDSTTGKIQSKGMKKTEIPVFTHRKTTMAQQNKHHLRIKNACVNSDQTVNGKGANKNHNSGCNQCGLAGAMAIQRIIEVKYAIPNSAHEIHPNSFE